MVAIGGRHAACVSRLNDWFLPRLPRTAAVRVQDPIRLPPRTEPEPDLVIVHRRADFYASGHPGPEDIFLVIEVSDTTLGYDRGVKLPLYAAAGIPKPGSSTWSIAASWSTAGRSSAYTAMSPSSSRVRSPPQPSPRSPSVWRRSPADERR